MPQTADPLAQGEDVNTWLRGTTDSLTPKTFELLLFLIIILVLRRFLTQDSSQNNNHEELVKITSSLSYAFTTQLKLSDKHITHLQEELTCAQRRIDKLEVKVQDQLKAPNESEQETTEQVKELQAPLTAAQLDQQHAKAAQKDLKNRLQYANQLLEKAKHDISNKNAEISALKDHLERYRIKMDNLTQQLDDTNDQLYMVRRELKHAYEQKQEHRERDPHVHESYQPNFWKNPWDQPRFSRNAKGSNNWKPNQTSKGNRLTHPRASRRGKRQRNPPQHYSDMHSAEYAPEPYSLPSEDMEQVMSQLNEFLQDKLNTDDYEIESCSL